MKNRMILIISITIFVMISLMSIGYSAFNTDLSISGEAKVKAKGDVMITNIEKVTWENSGDETFKPEFSRNLTSVSISLPNINSSVTYQVTITNNTTDYFTPGNKEAIINKNPNIQYELKELESYGVYQGKTHTFLITFTTTAPSQEANITMQYDLKPVKDTIWNFTHNGGYQTFTTQYNATYKVELWGASGGGNNIKESWADPQVEQ